MQKELSHSIYLKVPFCTMGANITVYFYGTDIVKIGIAGTEGWITNLDFYKSPLFKDLEIKEDA
ncbi:hypothetical protein HMPREF1982_01570 [Clostridiales bacterium oral taxon 876 str. F0540]|nr:hypothetical protein HMPREF1982_01570 [Clostridiales bacterium oral taxon 876 str. F0540]